MTPGSAAPTPAAALDVLVETVCDLLDVDYAGVHLVDHDVHRVRASSDAVPHPPMPRSDSLCGVLLTRQAPPAVGCASAVEIIEVSDTTDDPPCRTARVPRSRRCGSTPPHRCSTSATGRTLLLLGIAASWSVARCAADVDG